jgi:thioredoxin-related protein
MRYLLLLTLFISSLWSANIHWPSDYKQALQEAKKEHKLVYILITSDACQWCRKFEATTLQNKEIKKRLYKNYVTIHLSRDRNTIPKQFETAPVPRHYFTDANGKILYSSLGYRDETMFHAFMDNAEEQYELNKEKGKQK